MSAQTSIHSDGGLWYQYVRLFCNIRKWLTDIVKSNSIAVVGKKDLLKTEIQFADMGNWIYWYPKMNLPIQTQNQRPQQENKETPFQAKPLQLLLQPESHWLVEQAQRSDQCAISRQLQKQTRPQLQRPPHDAWLQSPGQPCLMPDVSDIRRAANQRNISS